MIERSIDRWINCSVDRQAGLWKGRSTPKAWVQMSQERKVTKGKIWHAAITEKCHLVNVASPAVIHTLTNSGKHSKRRSTVPSQGATEDIKEKVTRKEEAENNASKTQNPGNYTAASSASPWTLSLLSCGHWRIACVPADDFILMHTWKGPSLAFHQTPLQTETYFILYV